MLYLCFCSIEILWETNRELAQRANTSPRPTQAIYLLEQPPHPKPDDTIAALSFRVKNLVCPRYFI
ncbi:MAG: hypothetical protein RID53_30680 [Coleofasciculus sp. B1-GNL1-01]|uniref:hypothetical protein n=1 Tax=Coleofasciculus sp. B1-GNL1-01 TaxID=3068484 RepID=UPI0032F745E4